MSNRVQNQSSRQALMVFIRARRSFIKGTDSSSDMNPDLVVIFEDALVQMAIIRNILMGHQSMKRVTL